ncbi:putative ATP-dependent RNA helicase [Trichodelitschia bisporula]|uniref:Putative ATP-dependent RNA helicase n=1 Tax=Trichodelitschia bisporula TaxID=703511 RepID=A0A6G1HRI9_9PEZI|nr:putative ATP-dependent RNA helicase [Trichodelitschia bisporula]
MSPLKKRKLDSEKFIDVTKKKLAKKAASPAPESDSPAAEPDVPRADSVAAQKSFADLGVIDSLCEACEKLGYKAPTPIQEQSIPIALTGRDVIGLAETGSGKTAAFALPILQALMDKPQALFGLVLAPTRELAYQISQQFEALGSIIGVRCATIVGGMDMVAQSIALSKKPHIVVATPGRLLDHLESTKGFSLRSLKYLVMDEADRLLDMDFGPVLDKILKALPRDGRHTYLFSATMSTKVESLQRASLQNPVRVSVSSSSHQTVSTLLQHFLLIPHKDKDLYLVYLLSDMLAGQPAIVFARTVSEVQRLSYLLRALGISAIPIHGQLSQSARLGALSKFRARSRCVLVATDVAARGLDIPSVDAVLNFDLPDDSKTYVHRVGRTARAGKSGRAISFVTQYDAELWLRIEQALSRKLDEMPGIVKDEVMVLLDRVNEAQTVAKRELRDAVEKGSKKGGIGRGTHNPRGSAGGRGGGRGGGGGKRGRDDMDREEG